MNNDIYRALIEKINQPISIIQVIFNEIGDPVDYITLYMNLASETQLGLKREETIGRRAKEISPNAEREWFARYGEVVKTGISASIERHSSTFNKYFNNQVIPLGNDKVGILFQDITELRNKEAAEKKALEALQESEAKYRTIFETSQEGIWVIDGNDQTILVNERLEQMLGYSFDELEGKSPKDYMAPEFKASANERLAKHREGMKEAIDCRFINKDGSYLWCILSSTPLFDKNGKFDGSIAMITDITERKLADEALRKSEKRAMELVEKLCIADKNKNDFINMLSHELRNPLSSIMMSLELLEKVLPGEKQATMALGIAKRQGKQLTNLVDDLLDVTRITQNKVALKKETLEINDLIDKAVEDYQSQFVDKNVKLEVHLTTPLYIEADYSRLTQVISNLLHNSAKFTDKNDLVIISVTEDTNTGEVVITVQDTGRGMDPKEQLNLFEPFMQVDKSLDRRLGGLGLGLSVVKGMVELHGGRVEAFSEGIGKGTKFNIGLPL